MVVKKLAAHVFSPNKFGDYYILKENWRRSPLKHIPSSKLTSIWLTSVIFHLLKVPKKVVIYN